MKHRPPPRRSGEVTGQLQIEWTAGERQPPPPPTSTVPALVQRLPWDFDATFPQPTEEAIEQGTYLIEDATSEGVRSLHEEHAREALAALSALDAVLDARRLGVDPSTGKHPRTPAARERLRRHFEVEPARLEHAFRVLMDVYESVFGSKAADAFSKAIRAWHAGIEVVAEGRPSVGPLSEASQPPSRDAPGKAKPRRGEQSRVVARLPVPKPLPAAIAAGRFGQEESGANVRPGPHEVRAITEQHAQKLVELLHGAAQAAGPAEAERLRALAQSGLNQYAEDFGEQATRQLEAYVLRQVQPNALDGPPSRRRR